VFSVIFEVRPKPDQWDAYFGIAGMLRAELEQVEGFLDNVRYRSLTREGWILSLSSWRDEKAIVRWRSAARHRLAQQRGRSDIFLDYRLRVGKTTRDTRGSEGSPFKERTLEAPECGAAVVLMEAKRPEAARTGGDADWPGFEPRAAGLEGWDVFEAVLTPGDLILLTSWGARADAEAFENRVEPAQGARLRRVAIVRDYGLFDRAQAPQSYPSAPRHVS